jgi:hypothetical protein
MVSDSTALMDFDVEYSELLRDVSLALPHRRTVGQVYLLLVHSWLDGSVPAETNGLSSVNMIYIYLFVPRVWKECNQCTGLVKFDTANTMNGSVRPKKVTGTRQL